MSERKCVGVVTAVFTSLSHLWSVITPLYIFIFMDVPIKRKCNYMQPTHKIKKEKLVWIRQCFVAVVQVIWCCAALKLKPNSYPYVLDN